MPLHWQDGQPVFCFISKYYLFHFFELSDLMIYNFHLQLNHDQRLVKNMSAFAGEQVWFLRKDLSLASTKFILYDLHVANHDDFSR